MSTPASSSLQIDFSALAFPSDRITVADLRRVHPNRFNPPLGQAFNALETDRTFGLNDALYLERLLAAQEYERAAGQPGSSTRASEQMSRDSCIGTLTRLYQQYGLATGRKQTELLVKKLEVQAAKQAGPCR